MKFSDKMPKQVKEREIKGYKWVENMDPRLKDTGSFILHFPEPRPDERITLDYSLRLNVPVEDIKIVDARAGNGLKAIYRKKK